MRYRKQEYLDITITNEDVCCVISIFFLKVVAREKVGHHHKTPHSAIILMHNLWMQMEMMILLWCDCDIGHAHVSIFFSVLCVYIYYFMRAWRSLWWKELRVEKEENFLGKMQCCWGDCEALERPRRNLKFFNKFKMFKILNLIIKK